MQCVKHISIHALCEEGDGRRGSVDPVDNGFLSTPSARRATFYRTHDDNDSKISIHALCEEGDLSCG